MPKMHDVPDSAVTTGPAHWPDVETLFGVRGDPSRCWCRFFTLTAGEYNNTSPDQRKSQLRARFDSPNRSPGSWPTSRAHRWDGARWNPDPAIPASNVRN
ncbi:hypothetical protein ACW0JT_13405 [Arthrobacter sp. SA17]